MTDKPMLGEISQTFFCDDGFYFTINFSLFSKDWVLMLPFSDIEVSCYQDREGNVKHYETKEKVYQAGCSWIGMRRKLQHVEKDLYKKERHFFYNPKTINEMTVFSTANRPIKR